EGFFALHCCLSSNWVRDAELCTMIVPLRDGRVKGSRQCSRQPSLAEMSAAADMSRSRAERALTSVKRKLGPEAELQAMTAPWSLRRGYESAVRPSSSSAMTSEGPVAASSATWVSSCGIEVAVCGLKRGRFAARVERRLSSLRADMRAVPLEVACRRIR